MLGPYLICDDQVHGIQEGDRHSFSICGAGRKEWQAKVNEEGNAILVKSVSDVFDPDQAS